MDWPGYALADLVPFSRETWFALVAGYNREHLPAVGAGLGVGVLLLWLTARPECRRPRVALALLGLCWVWIGWAFLHRELGALLWAADWLAWGFAGQGLLMLAAALQPASDPGRRTGWAAPGWWMLACAVVLLPALARATGGGWSSIGWFGSAPDATVLGTLGVLTLLPGRSAWLLLPVPVLWCALSAGMLYVFGDPRWPLPLCAAALTMLLLARARTLYSRGLCSRL